MPSCPFVHLILKSKGQKVPKSGSFKNEGIHEVASMRIAIIAGGDPLDIHTWSGIPYHMVEALKCEFPDLIVIQKPFPRTFKFCEKVMSRLSRGKIQLGWFRSATRLAAIPVLRRLAKIKPDLVISIANTSIGSVVSSHFPTIHISDTTFALMKNYYSSFADMYSLVKSAGDALEKTVILQSKACLYPSRWAAESAIHDYHADPERVHILPWGCNMPTSAMKDYGIDGNVGINSPLNIVFIGVDWERKGGNIALEAVQGLRQSGIPAHLHVIGVRPDGVNNSDGVTIHGFVSKSTPDGQSYLDKVMRTAAFILLPTRRECYGMVFAEANAYGIPAITTLTGGVGSVVTDGVNGYCLPETADPSAYARLIAEIWSDPSRYLALRKSSRRHQETVLNWASWGRSVREVINTLGQKSSVSQL
jgi:glycosyltransferase involved in cell wall biosynthesis